MASNRELPPAPTSPGAPGTPVLPQTTVQPVVNIQPATGSLPIIDLPEDIKNCAFYHGRIPRVEAELSLRTAGDYLLRKAEGIEGIYLVVSARNAITYFHFPISQEKETNKFYLDSIKEASVLDLLTAHVTQQVPLSKTSGCLITRAVPRPQWLVKHSSLIMYKKLGAGAFGEVFLARMEDPTSEIMLDCAVKSMKSEATSEARLRFMKESRMMRKSYQHKNVVMILGIAVMHNPLLIIMELCPNGSLVSYLRKNKGTTTIQEKLRFVTEAASGLAYLEAMGCVHRDVAARNCLLSATNEIKISDFGLADDRCLMIDNTLEKMPIKWLAPETMQEKIYSLKSDIWAFGVLCWETYADGEEPYPGLTPIQTRAKIVVQDYRMKMADDTQPEVVKIVEQCWEKNADKRGTMREHFGSLTKLVAPVVIN